MRVNVAACEACVPCEKFWRTMSVPAAMSASSTASESLAGPTVAMILVWRMYSRSIMGQIVPDPVERYLAGLNHLSDPVLEEIARRGAEEDLPLIDSEVGALLRVLATAIGATRILEIGTAIGYSGIWLAGALPPTGMFLTFEKDPERARLAREHFARAGLAERVHVIIGDAQRMLAKV